jgi:hypothetical protein
MNAHSPLPFDAASEPTAGHAAWGQALLRRQAAMLETLAEAGLRMALAIERQVTEAPADGEKPVAPAEAAMAFSRVARAVRMTALLQSKLIEAHRVQARDGADRGAAAHAGAARILRGLIEDDDRAGDRERTERLKAEAAERLEREHLEDLDARAFGEAVAGICKDLGLSPDWLRLAEDCAAARARAGGKPGAVAEASDDDQVQVLWIDPDSPPGETRYYDPDERRRQRQRQRDSS